MFFNIDDGHAPSNHHLPCRRAHQNSRSRTAGINRPGRVDPSADAASASGTKPTTQAPDEFDDWEANAPRPSHFAGHAFEQPSFDRQASTSEAGDFTDPREELRDALYAELHDRPGEEPSAPFSPFRPFESHDTPTATASADTPVSPHDALRCPHCRSSRIDTLNRARRAGSTIGSVAGATSGMAMALSGAEAGAVVGSFAGPIGTVFGGLAGAVIAGLVGSAAGCAAGSAVGSAIDDNVLDNHLCLACGHAFSATGS